MEWAVHKYSLMEGAVEKGWRVMLKNLDGCDELSWKDNNREHWRWCKARGEEKGCTNRMLKWPLTGAEDCFKTIAVLLQVRGGQLREKYHVTPVEFHKQDFSDTIAQAWLIKKK